MKKIFLVLTLLALTGCSMTPQQQQQFLLRMQAMDCAQSYGHWRQLSSDFGICEY